jgi:seryl-tRNA synthetase
MLDARFIRENLDYVSGRLAARGESGDLGYFRELDEERRSLLQETDDMKALRNAESAEIGKLRKLGQDAAGRQESVRSMGDRIRANDERIKEVEGELNRFLLTLPNLPHESVPVGRDEIANETIRTWGQKPDFSFKPLPHWDLGEALGIIDLPRAAKISGARFSLLKGAGAGLERALINFMLDLHTREHGYTEVLTPFMVQPSSMMGTGQLPKFEEDLFHVEGGEFYLVPTAEVPVTNIHREEILAEADLPVFPEGGRLPRQGHPGPHPAAPVQQGRARQIHQARRVLRRTGVPHRKCRGGFKTARTPLPGNRSMHGRPRFFLCQDLRSGGLAAGAGNVPGNILLQQF